MVLKLPGPGTLRTLRSVTWRDRGFRGPCPSILRRNPRITRCRRSAWTALLCFWILCSCCASAWASAPRIERVQVEVLAREGGLAGQTLRMHARYHFEDWQGGQALTLLNFAEFFAEPKAEDRLGTMPHLQGPHDQGRLRIHKVSVGGKAHSFSRQGRRRDLVIAPLSAQGPSLRGELDIEYTLEIPRRSWPFGCVRGKCSLSGAIAPLPAQALAHEGQYVIAPAHWELHWPECANRPRALFVQDSSRAKNNKLFYPQVAWANRSAKRFRSSEFLHRGVSVRIWGARGEGIGKPDLDSFWAWDKNVRRELAHSAREAIDVALEFGLDLGFGDSLAIVVGPYFADISMPEGQSLMVSSSYLDVLPLKRFSGFHRSQLMRSLLDTLAMQHLQRRGVAPDDMWVAGALGNALSRRAAILKEQKKGDIAHAVHGLRFMPMVDQMLYGGQTSNAGAFFDSVEDALPLRNHALYFSHSMPRGGRLAFKLRDALGQASFDRWVDRIIQEPRQKARQLADELANKDLPPEFFEQWLGPYPEVDYAILDVDNKKQGDEWICKVTLARESDVEIHESVDVRFGFAGKRHQELVWRPRGKGQVRDTLTLRSKQKVKRVRLDPHGKLLQVAKFSARRWEKPGQHDPLFNDRSPAGYRFLYTGIGFHLAVAEFLSAKTKAARLRSFDGYLSFAAGLRRDLRREFSFLIAKDRDTLLNLGGGLALFFGRKVTSNRRRLRLSIDSEVDFLTPLGLDMSRGIRTTQSLSLIDDTQTFLFEPHRGHRYKFVLKRSDVWTPKPGPGKREHAGFWRVGADLSHRFRLAHGHVLALQAVGEMVFIETIPEFRGLARAGGLGRLSAFGADEIYARAVGVGLAEYRHTILDHTRLNALGFAWMRNLGGVLSTGVGTTSTCESFAGFGAKENWYGQVGYGVTTLFDFLGMAPEFLRIDVSLPIGRRERYCLGRKFPDALAQVQGLPVEKVKSLLPKLSFNILIEQPF